MIRLSFHRLILLLLPLVAAAAPARAEPGPLEAQLLAMRALDERVTRIGHRLAVAAVDLCREREWRPGFALHDLSQYGGAWREAAIRAFGLGDGPAVLAVVAGGPAERAGLRPDDVVIAVDVEPLPRAGDSARRDFDPVERMLDRLERAFADGAATLELRRGGAPLTLQVDAERGCATRFQIVPSSRLNARADGRYVQATTAIGAYVADDDELAAVLAHEFAHNVLRHREGLDAAGVARGFLSHFGRNARLIRETELEADRLSVHLLARAGFDPEAPIRFWRRFGPRGLGLFDSPNHPHWRQRVEAFEAEVEAVRRAQAAGVAPAPDFLATPARERR